MLRESHLFERKVLIITLLFYTVIGCKIAYSVEHEKNIITAESPVVTIKLDIPERPLNTAIQKQVNDAPVNKTISNRNDPWDTTEYLGFSLTDDPKNDEIKCLALNIYHEARSEPIEGQYAVAIVTMNRVANEYYPDSVCDVVWQKKWSSRAGRYIAQFSWSLDGKSDIPKNRQAWAHSVKLAIYIYHYYKPELLPQLGLPLALQESLHYHADYVAPVWSKRMATVTKVGRHIFYN